MTGAITLSNMASEAVQELNQLRQFLRSNPDEETIHRFRVLYKKTRALYRMAGTVNTGKAFRLRNTWKQVYQGAGTVRDTQLLQNLVSVEIGEGPLTVLLLEQLHHHQHSFNDILRQSDPGKEHFDKWKKGTSQVADYFRSMFAELRLYYRQPLYDEELHAIRKLLKDIMYNLAWLSKAGIPIPDFLVQIPVSELDALQKWLGDYQDNVVQSSIVRQLAVLPAVREDSEKLEIWISNSFRRQVALRASVEPALENFFHLHAPGSFDE